MRRVGEAWGMRALGDANPIFIAALPICRSHRRRLKTRARSAIEKLPKRAYRQYFSVVLIMRRRYTKRLLSKSKVAANNIENMLRRILSSCIKRNQYINKARVAARGIDVKWALARIPGGGGNVMAACGCSKITPACPEIRVCISKL